MKKYIIYRLNTAAFKGGAAGKSFLEEFTTSDEANKYFLHQHELLTQFEGLTVGTVGKGMITYFYGQELKVVLVVETKYE